MRHGGPIDPIKVHPIVGPMVEPHQVVPYQRCGYCGYESPAVSRWGCDRCGRCTAGQFTRLNRIVG